MKNLQTHHGEADSLNTFVEETMPILWFIAPGFTPGMMRNPERGSSLPRLRHRLARAPWDRQMVLRKMGGKMPPPPFAPFWLNTLFFTVWFGPLWGLLMWFGSWKNDGFSVPLAVLNALFAGLLFGLFMALIHSWRKRANKLPDWKSL